MVWIDDDGDEERDYTEKVTVMFLFFLFFALSRGRKSMLLVIIMMVMVVMMVVMAIVSTMVMTTVTKMMGCQEFVWMFLYNELFLGSHQRWKVIEG